MGSKSNCSHIPVESKEEPDRSGSNPGPAGHNRDETQRSCAEPLAELCSKITASRIQWLSQGGDPMSVGDCAGELLLKRGRARRLPKILSRDMYLASGHISRLSENVPRDPCVPLQGTIVNPFLRQSGMLHSSVHLTIYSTCQAAHICGYIPLPLASALETGRKSYLQMPLNPCNTLTIDMG